MKIKSIFIFMNKFSRFIKKPSINYVTNLGRGEGSAKLELPITSIGIEKREKITIFRCWRLRYLVKLEEDLRLSTRGGQGGWKLPKIGNAVYERSIMYRSLKIVSYRLRKQEVWGSLLRRGDWIFNINFTCYPPTFGK